MTRKLKTLLSDFPNVDPAAMGFSRNWEDEPVWNSGGTTYGYHPHNSTIWCGYMVKNTKMMAVMMCVKNQEFRNDIAVS